MNIDKLPKTWVDVEQVCIELQKASKWKEGVALWTYTDSFTFEYVPSIPLDQLKQWLRDNLNDDYQKLFVEDLDDSYFKLDIEIEGFDRLPIRFKQVDESVIEPNHYSTTFRRPFSIRALEPVKIEPPFDHPRIVAFHSFKGGVGRTLHAIGLAQHLIRDRGMKVLLVDADFEAPGISWLHRNFRLTLADFMVLFHAANSESDYPKIIAYFKENIQAFGTQLYILPALPTKGNYQLTITPDNLNAMTDNPFFLNHRLIELGHALGVDYILVDLRAGKSELASGWLLDPEVYKVLVTTLSSQAVQGTIQVMELLKQTYIRLGYVDALPPHIVISQFVWEDDIKELYDLWNQQDSNITDSVRKTFTIADHLLWLRDCYQSCFFSSDPDTFHGLLNPTLTVFDKRLLILPKTWDSVIRRVGSALPGDCWKHIDDWLPVLNSTIRFSSSSQAININNVNDQIKHQRSEIANYFKQVADTKPGEHQVFVYTKSIQKLVNSFLTKPPSCSIIGTTGVGKTTLLMEMVKQQTWNKFSQTYANTEALDAQYLIIPIDFPHYFQEALIRLYPEITRELVSISFDDPTVDFFEGSTFITYIIFFVKAYLDHDPFIKAGFPGTENFEQLEVGLKAAGIKLIFVSLLSKESRYEYAYEYGEKEYFDHLSRFSQKFPFEVKSIAMLSGKDWASNYLKDRTFSIDFQLEWTNEDVLRLIVLHLMSVKNLSIQKLFQEANPTFYHINTDESSLERLLYPFWGKKLGKDDSNAPYTADYIYGIFRTYNKNLGKFLYDFSSALQGIDQTDEFPDRLIPPAAIFKLGKMAKEQK